MPSRPLTPADIDTAPDWMREIPLRPDGWRDGHTRSVIEADAAGIFAVGILWTSRVHTDRFWFEIAVDPARRRRGAGRRMFAQLTRLRADDLPFISRGYVDEERVAFIRALGGRVIQVVPPAQIATAQRTLLRAHSAVGGAAGVDDAALRAANAATYAWTHATWSPVAADFADALNEDLADELDLDASSVAVRDGAVVALCLVYRDTTPPVVTAETTARHTPDGEHLVEGCVRRSLDVLAARGVREVEFDGHVSDPHLLPVWTRLQPTGRWFHLFEVAPAGGRSAG